MKTRNGFVSNSSSSSFIVCFPKGKPADVVDLQRLLFGTETTYSNPYQYGGEPNSWPVSEVAAIVWNDLKDQRPLVVSDIADDMDHHYNTNVEVEDLERPEYPDYPNELYDLKDPKAQERHPSYKKYVIDLKKYEEASQKWAQQMALSLTKKAHGEFYRFSYSDNDGAFMSALEHGDLFKNLPHIRVSNH